MLHLAVLMTAHEDDTRSVQPPHIVRAPGFVGRRLGYEA